MFNNKTIKILRKLTAPELNKFEQYIRSPLHNNSENVINTFIILKQAYPNFDAEWIERSLLYPRLFPDSDDFVPEKHMQPLRYKLTDLGKKLQEFLAWLQFDKSKFYKTNYLLDAYLEKSLNQQFQEELNKLKISVNRNPSLKNIEFYKRKYLLEEYQFRFLSETEPADQGNLLQVVDSFDIFYLANKLKYTCEILNNKNVIALEYYQKQLDYQIFLFNDIKNRLPSKIFEDIPPITIYYQILLTLRDDENENLFNKLLVLLNRHQGKFSKKESVEIYTYACNYCIRKINSGKSSYLRKLHDIYHIRIENDLLLIQNNNLSEREFLNICIISLRLGLFDWTNNFIQTHLIELPLDRQLNAQKYIMSQFHFHKGEYDMTLGSLRDVNLDDVYYRLNSRAITLKTFYELKYTNSFNNLVVAFRNFLNYNQDVSEIQKNSFRNLILFTKRLYRLRDKKEHKSKNITNDINRLKDKILEADKVADITWLLTKLDELY